MTATADTVTPAALVRALHELQARNGEAAVSDYQLAEHLGIPLLDVMVCRYGTPQAEFRRAIESCELCYPNGRHDDDD